MENFLFPDEIVLKILGYLGLGDLIQCSKVSRRFNTICKDKSLSYRSSMSIMKDLTLEDQKRINNMLIDLLPDCKITITKLVIDSVSWEEGDESKLSRAMAARKFLGPKKCSLEKKKEVLKALGASVRVKYAKIRTSIKTMMFGPLANFTASALADAGRQEGSPGDAFGAQRRPLEIGLFYSMPKGTIQPGLRCVSPGNFFLT